jgi:hypothetical protein
MKLRQNAAVFSPYLCVHLGVSLFTEQISVKNMLGKTKKGSGPRPVLLHNGPTLRLLHPTPSPYSFVVHLTIPVTGSGYP